VYRSLDGYLAAAALDAGACDDVIVLAVELLRPSLPDTTG
jgi:hypothetical protein